MIKSIIRISKPLRYAFNNITYNAVFSGSNSKIREFKNKYNNKPIMIVGNGPSLNQTPLDMLTNIPSIGMNKISMIFSRTIWRPSLIVCVNNLVVRQHKNFFQNSDIPIFLAWKSKLHMPLNTWKNVKYLNLSNDNEFRFELDRKMGGSATVTYAALQLAYFLGASEVFLVGVDHSFKTDGKPLEYKKRDGVDVNHFDPSYFASGQWWGVPDLDLSEYEYNLAKQVFENNRRKVFDATIGGKLQIFEKVSIDKLIEISQKLGK